MKYISSVYKQCSIPHKKCILQIPGTKGLIHSFKTLYGSYLVCFLCNLTAHRQWIVHCPPTTDFKLHLLHLCNSQVVHIPKGHLLHYLNDHGQLDPLKAAINMGTNSHEHGHEQSQTLSRTATNSHEHGYSPASSLFSENENQRRGRFLFSENRTNAVLWEQKSTMQEILFFENTSVLFSENEKNAGNFGSQRTTSALLSENENLARHWFLFS